MSVCLFVGISAGHLEGRNSPVRLLLAASGRLMSAPRVLGGLLSILV